MDTAQQEIEALRQQLAAQREIQQGLENYINKALAEIDALEDEIKWLKYEKTLGPMKWPTK